MNLMQVLEDLVELEMRDSQLKNLGQRSKKLGKLIEEKLKMEIQIQFQQHLQ
jgi:hypothetical protein